ncbi:MAG: hypothetical protein EOO92_23770 [Pedobacter sp.]|nr:MAG: hypothetical protein EOO92_23770 [Pedobacter sp.]
MAKIEGNVIMQGMSGTIGKQLVFKNYSYGTVVSRVPDMSKVIPTALQKAEKNRFKLAVAYAKQVLANPAMEADMRSRTPVGKRVYHQAISEFMSKENL